MKTIALKITCPAEPDIEGTYSKDAIEEDMRDMMQSPQGSDWIEWVMFLCDTDDYFNDKLVEIVSMPTFIKGTFMLKDVEFTFEKVNIA